MAARKPIDPSKPISQVLLDALNVLQLARYRIGRAADVMDYSRDGADFTPLAAALGAGMNAQQAEELYARFRTVQSIMNGPDFQNMADIDLGG